MTSKTVKIIILYMTSNNTTIIKLFLAFSLKEIRYMIFLCRMRYRHREFNY